MTELSVVADNTTPETPAVRIARLQAEARQEGAAMVERLLDHLAKAAALAREINEAGDAVPVGIQARCAPLAHSADMERRQITLLMQRAGR